MTSRTGSDAGRTSAPPQADGRAAAAGRATAAGAPPSGTLSRQHRIVIAVLMVAAFTVILNETVMSVALPVLQDDLGVALSVAQWLTTAYMLTMAVVIPLTGFLIQRVPTRRLLRARDEPVQRRHPRGRAGARRSGCCSGRASSRRPGRRS